MEAALPGTMAALELVDEDCRLSKGAAPSLPDSIVALLEGAPVCEGVGPAGSSALRGQLVIVEDLSKGPYWAEFLDLTASAGISACWSQPVFDSRARVVASVSLYSRRPTWPADHDLAVLAYAANLVGIVVERNRSEKHLHMALLALEHTRESVFWLDEFGRVLYVNPAAVRELGYSAEALRRMSILDIDPSTPVELLGPDGGQNGRLHSSGLRKFESRHYGHDGRAIPVEVDSDPFTYDLTQYFIVIARDISARLAVERSLRESESKFAAMFALTPDPMALSRLDDGVLLEVSRSWQTFFGYDYAECVGRAKLAGDLGLWVKDTHRQRWKALIERQGELVGFETPMRRKDGSVAMVRISGKVMDIAGQRCVVTSVHDVTEQKRNQKRLEEMANHDPLTKLPNRLLLGDRLRQAIAQSERTATRVAVCYLDLDGFKAVNDTLGHGEGDCLLIEMARRLTAAVRRGETVARLGGDEFIVLLSGLTDDEQIRIALDRLIKVASAPVAVSGKEVAISASIGVTVFPGDSADPDTLVRHADHAMYAAKQAGKNRFHFFDMPLELGIEARLSARQRIADGLADGQFRLFFQPKVDCRAGRVVGAEALIRWQHPNLGLLSPREFLPLIEDDALEVTVGDWVTREALKYMAAWQRRGLDLRVSVNAFGRQLLAPGFVERIGQLLSEYPEVPSGRLEIEIVERIALGDVGAVRAVVDACHALGVEFALDDFGTGHSSLIHLRHLPAREMKIDQSFVQNMLTNPEDLAIVEAVIGLGRAFHLSVTAEGAETPAHISRLLALGCDVMQGYGLARPMAAEELVAWALGFRPDPAWLGGSREVKGAT